jgi:hypothetical protein
MTALPRRRRRNTLLALASGLVAAVTVPTLVYVGAKAIANSTAGQNVLAGQAPEQSFPKTPTAMLATVNAANELTSVTMFVLAPDGDPSPGGYDQRGGSVISVPVSANAGDAAQPVSLHDAFAQGGEDELRLDVESVLNVGIDFSRVMTREEFAGFLLGLPSVAVTLPADVLGSNDALVVAKGAVTLTPQQLAEIVTSKSPTQREALRRADIEAVWAGIVATIGVGRQGQTLSPAGPTTFDELAARLLAGQMASRGLLARPLDAVDNPQNLDVETLDSPDTTMVFASIAPASMSKPGSGRAYRIEAPPGFDAQVRRTIGLLQYFHDNVVSVDLNAAAKPETVFKVYDPQAAKTEPTSNDLFGAITVQTPTTRLSGIEVTIALGTTYLAGVDLSAPDPSTTIEAGTETTG